MAYQALYRKFRPDQFDGVIGQDAIVKTLKNQIEQKRASHAYLFCGTRGTGKTSTAKIFAKAINCLHQKQGEPCGECEMCQAIKEGRSMNVVEIDAASNNGVDNIRDIREEVKYAPTEGKFKVYIIDEVHMLSQGAFNALLKTLEEPPPHVIFILATTDPQKVPVTILSRCQRFDFRRISSITIAKTLKKYLEEEEAEVSEEALNYIARLSDGSMRDSLSILDQCMAFFYGEEITLEKVLEIVGAVDQTMFFDMTEAISKKDLMQAMNIVEQIMLQGRSISQFVIEWTEHLRNLLVASTVTNPISVLDYSTETVQKFKEQSRLVSAEELIYYIKTISELGGNLKYASNERILLEVGLIKLCSSLVEENFDALAARLAELERTITTGRAVLSQDKSVNLPTETTTVKMKPMREKALPEDFKKAIELWSEVKNSFDSSIKGLLSAVSLGYMDNDCLTLICDNEAVEGIVQNKLETISLRLDERLMKSFPLRLVTKKEYGDWEKNTYGTKNQEAKDEEFESLLQGYFPDAQIE